MPTARDRGPVAHVFLAIAVALPVLLAAGSIGLAMVEKDQTVLNVWLLSLLALGFVAVVGWAAYLPPVRQVEIGAARALLGVDLPDVRHPRAADSRRRGALWLLLLVLLGLVLTVALLYLVPTGVGLMAHPLSGRDSLDWPGGDTWEVGAGWSSAWLVLPGALALVLSVALVVGSGRLLRAYAPRILGPTLAEQVAERVEHERDLARANALAREVHDGIGHTLTAMTLQVTAARRLLHSNPDAADRSLAAVEDLGRRAQADVDEVVGALRRGTERVLRPVPTDLRPAIDQLVADTPLRVDVRVPARLPLPADVAAAAVQVVREGLTNAARHGTGDARLAVLLDEHLVVQLTNSVAPQQVPAPGRSGLIGLREQVLLVDGKLEAGQEGLTWTLRATLPTN